MHIQVIKPNMGMNRDGFQLKFVLFMYDEKMLPVLYGQLLKLLIMALNMINIIFFLVV